MPSAWDECIILKYKWIYFHLVQLEEFMNLFTIFRYFFFVSICLSPSLSIADEEEHEQHGKHVHGEGELQVVLENQNLHLKFVIPAMNIVGFEHQAKTGKQKQVVQKVVTYLRNTDGVFKISSDAQCRLQSSNANFVLLGDNDHHEGEEQEGEEEHEEKGHHEEHEGKKEHKEVESRHAEFQSQYQFSCENPKKLETIELLIFKDLKRHGVKSSFELWKKIKV